MLTYSERITTKEERKDFKMNTKLRNSVIGLAVVILIGALIFVAISSRKPKNDVMTQNISKYGTVIGNLAGNANMAKADIAKTSSGNTVSLYVCADSIETTNSSKFLAVIDMKKGSDKDVITSFKKLIPTLVKEGNFHIKELPTMAPTYFILSIDGTVQNDYIIYKFDKTTSKYVYSSEHLSPKYMAFSKNA